VAHGRKWLAAFDLIVFDEGSNIDTKLLSQVLACVPNACKLVMIGDYGQIYPISPGCPFKDLSEYFASSSFSLTENKRVNVNSRALADASKLIATGDITQIDFEGPALSIVDRSDDAIYAFLDKYCTCIGDIMNIQFVALRNADRKMLNEKIEQWLLRKKMLFKSKRVKLTAGGAHTVYAQSKITFKKNTNPSIGASVRNGELAQVISSAPMSKKQVGHQVGYMLTLQNGKTILVNATGDDGVNYRDIEAGYASTCNKSQGSEWDVILFYMYEGCQDVSVWSRSYPYVAVSRAKLHCTIMGTRQELQTIVRRVQPERHTVLRYLLGKSQVNVNVNYAVIDEEDTTNLELMDPDIAPVPRLKDYAEKKSKKIKK
jgi:exodeoxyribonuclease V alpha subunit